MFNPAAPSTPVISRRHRICQPRHPNPHQPHNTLEHQGSTNNQSDPNTANNKSPYAWYFTRKNNQAGSASVRTAIKQLSVCAPCPVTTGCSLMNRTTKSSADRIFKILSASVRTPNPAELALTRTRIPKVTNSQQALMWLYLPKQHQSEQSILNSSPVFEDNTSPKERNSKEHNDNPVLTVAKK